jgi:hypothetical protein
MGEHETLRSILIRVSPSVTLLTKQNQLAFAQLHTLAPAVRSVFTVPVLRFCHPINLVTIEFHGSQFSPLRPVPALKAVPKRRWHRFFLRRKTVRNAVQLASAYAVEKRRRSMR